MHQCQCARATSGRVPASGRGRRPPQAAIVGPGPIGAPGPRSAAPSGWAVVGAASLPVCASVRCRASPFGATRLLGARPSLCAARCDGAHSSGRGFLWRRYSRGEWRTRPNRERAGRHHGEAGGASVRPTLRRASGRPTAVSHAWGECEIRTAVAVAVTHAPDACVTTRCSRAGRWPARGAAAHAPRAYVTVGGPSARTGMRRTNG